jgi:D-amino-acid dehydrogenase
LQQETQRIGVQLRHGIEVHAFRVNGARIEAVETNAGIIEADEFVLTAGIWSSPLARQLGLSLPMQAGKGYSLTVEMPSLTAQRCAILSEARAAMTPMGATLRFGGTMEITGIDETIEPARVRGIVKAIGTYFPDATPDALAASTIRTGLRPCSPDGLPYIGRFARFSNLSAATGHAMMGVSLAPITGRLIAEVLSGERTSIPIAALSPDRYARSRRPAATKEAAVATTRATTETRTGS